MTGVVLRDGKRFSNISVLRSKAAGPCSKDETAFLTRLIPHVQRALALHSRMVDLDRSLESAAHIFDKLPTALFLVDAKGSILMLNRPARAIAEQNDGLSTTRVGLRAVLVEENRQLQGLIRGAIMTGTGKDIHPGGAMTVSRPSLRRPYGLIVSPIRTNRSWLGAVLPRAVVFVNDPESKTEKQDQILGRMFGLTPAEARLADALVEGKNLKETAEKFGVTRNTVHSQLQKIFEKTGTNRQSELLRVLLTSIAHLQSS
jgi:DNA-binding CsgD family transcriptional regulator